MENTFSTPWDFHNNDLKVHSPRGRYNLAYYDLIEIAMGAPLGGKCFLESDDNMKIKIHDWCGGPPVWETNGLKVAIPIWIRNWDTFQLICVVDLNSLQRKIYSRKFSVLNLKEFKDVTIHGIDSPNYKPASITFDTTHEDVKETFDLKKNILPPTSR